MCLDARHEIVGYSCHSLNETVLRVAAVVGIFLTIYCFNTPRHTALDVTT